MIKKIIIFILFICISSLCYAQTHEENIAKIEALSKEVKGYDKIIRTEVSGTTLYDFISIVADENKLSIDVDPKLEQIVRGSFYDVPVKQVIGHLIKKHELLVDVSGKILILRKKEEVKEEPKPIPPKVIDVKFNEANGFLSLKLKNDSLPSVAQAITDASKKNIVLSPKIKNQTVTSYILNRPFDQVMDMMAKANGLTVTKDENDFYFVDKADVIPDEVANAKGGTRRGGNVNRQGGRNRNTSNAGTGSYTIEVDKKGFLTVSAYNGDLTAMITEAAEKLNVNYFMYNNPEGETATLLATGITFEEFLEHVFKGKKFTYKNTGEVILIGEHSTQGLRTTQLIQMENRSIESVEKSIPKALRDNLEIQEFIELNGIVVSGSEVNIKELRAFLKEIDKVVANINIEVIIVQYQKGFEIQTGIQAGLDSRSRTTSGVLFPTSEVELNSSSVNNLIDAFNGLGIVNLGKVTENFYLNLQALENNSFIKLESTPKLSTTNGHEATSTIGETSYYFEQQNELQNIGGNTNGVFQSGQWKPTEANLDIKIKPFVSKDEHVTLEITVEQSSFLARVGEGAPPGKATRKFESMVRVKNNEMIVLGGLDELERENSGTGTPFFSRIPIIKWFFSSRKKKKEKSKLHILIKPTVTY